MGYIVYTHRTPNNKYYVGITKRTAQKRWNYSYGYASQKLFWRAIQKYGWDNIEHTIVAENLSHDEACALEVELIAKYKSNNPKYGYNRTIGGDGTCGFSHENPCSEERKLHISQALKGKQRTEEQKQHMRDAAKGRTLSEETKKKISNTVKRKNLIQFAQTKEAKDNWSKKRKVPIILLDDSGDMIKSFCSMTECANYLGVSIALISNILNGKHRSSKYANKLIRKEVDDERAI